MNEKKAIDVNKIYSENFIQPNVEKGSVPTFLKKYLKESDHIIDLGCGDGGMIYGFSKENKNLKVTGIDISPRRINQLKKNFPKYKFFCEDVCKTSLKPNSQDIIYSSQVIEHVEDDNKMLQEINRIAKKKAIIYLGSVIKEPWAIYKYKNRKGKFCLDPTHEREYKNIHQFSEILTKNKLKIINIWKTPVKRKLIGLTIPIPGFYLIEAICKK